MQRSARWLWLSVAVLAASGLHATAVECVTPRSWENRLRNSPRDQNQNGIDDALDELPPGEIVTVVLDLNRCPEDQDIQRLSTFGRLQSRGRWLSYAVFEQVKVDDLATLVKDPIVAFIESDRKVQLFLDVSVRTIKVRPSTTYSPNTIDDKYPGTNGAGINVAIIDTGVDDGVHESLPATKFVGGANCLSNPCVELNPDDVNGHGTHVAGIAIGTGGPSATNRGVAPAAGLVDLQTFDASGLASTATILRAMQKTLDRRVSWNIRVVNMSFGDCTATNGTDVKSEMVNRMVHEGLAIAIASGNNTNCALPTFSSLVQAPAGADDGVSIGNDNDQGTIARGDDAISGGSLQGPRSSDGDLDTADEQKPDIAAPGTIIRSAQVNTLSGYVDKSGTSMAAPHIAGCMALILQRVPTITPLSVKQLLLETAEDKGPAGWDQAWGKGLVDCYAAIDKLATTTGNDLGFDVYIGRPGAPPWYLSPDLVPSSPTITEGASNTINATVKNYGPAAVTNFQVSLGVYNFSNSDPNYHICTKTVTSVVPAGGSVTVSCAWTPAVSGPPPGSIHACLKAEVIYPYDTSFTNNKAQHNINVVQAFSPARFNIGVSNPTEQRLDVQLRVQSCDCGQGPISDCNPQVPCPGWTLRLLDPAITLQPDDCPKTTQAILDPVDRGATREAQVNLNMVGVNVQGQQFDLGGVGIRGRLGCNVSPLLFPLPISNKSRFGWNAAPFDACARAFDVARGPLPINSGAFDTGTCLSNDGFENSFNDGAVPSPGRGFWYLVRTGGPAAGSYDDGTQTGSRDVTLISCP